MTAFQKVLVVEGVERTLDYALSAELAGLGFASVTAPLEATNDILDVIPTPSAILFHLPRNPTAEDYEPFLSLAQRLRGKEGLAHVPMIAVEPGGGTTTLPPGVSVLDMPAAAQLRSTLDKRFASAARLRRMEEEFARRLRTVEAMLGESVVTDNNRPACVLLVGDDAALDALAPLLELQGLEVRRLGGSRLDSVSPGAAVDLIVVAGQADATIGRLRRDSRVSAAPVMVIPEQGCDPALADLEASVSECVDAVVLKACEQRHRDVLGARLHAVNADMLDPATGLCTPGFFRRHLGRVVQDAAAKDEPLSLALIRTLPDGARASAGPARGRIADALAAVLRPEDFATELSFGVFAAAFVGCERDLAKTALDDIAVRVRRTGITGSNDSAVVGITTGLAEIAEGDTANALVSRALAVSEA